MKRSGRRRSIGCVVPKRRTSSCPPSISIDHYFLGHVEVIRNDRIRSVKLLRDQISEAEDSVPRAAAVGSIPGAFWQANNVDEHGRSLSCPSLLLHGSPDSTEPRTPLEANRKDGNNAIQELPKAGVTLAFVVDEFIEKDCGGRSNLRGLTTTEVCEKFIKPKTQEQQISYCDYLEQRDHPEYGRVASVFISHAHQYLFLDLICALEWHFWGTSRVDDGEVTDLRDGKYDSAHSRIVIWLDIFSINQHAHTAWTFDWLSNAFMSAIRTFGRTVMVLSPWYAPIPFTRLWCIFEAYCSTWTQSRFEIAMSPLEQRQFLSDMSQYDPQKLIKQLLATIRAEKAQCSVENDREGIVAVIQKSVGFATINSMVFEKYRDWVIQVCLNALKAQKLTRSIEDDKLVPDAECVIMHTVGSLYLGQGKYREAEPYLVACFRKRSRTLGEAHQVTLRTMSYLGRCIVDQGRYNEGRSLLEDCTSKRIATLGEDHPETLESMDDLAALHQCLAEFSSAKGLYDSCLTKRRQSLGEDHPDTFESINNLAGLFMVQAQYSEARELYEECLSKRKKKLGKTHPDTLTSIHNLAALFECQGAYHVMAQTLYEVCLSKRKILLGDKHPSTLTTMNNLASLYCRQGKFQLARPLFVECLEKRKVVLGEWHAETLMSMQNLAGVIETLVSKDEAEILYSRCFENFETCLENERTQYGSDFHPTILKLLHTLAGLHLKRGHLDQARDIYASCVEKRSTLLGENHPHTLMSMNELGLAYYRLDDFSASRAQLVDCLEKRRQVLGEEHPDTLESIHNLALWHDTQREYETARVLYEECLSKRRSKLGQKHPRTALTMHNLSIVQYNLGHLENARELFEECLILRKGLFGDYNPIPNQVHDDDIMSLLETAYTYDGREGFTPIT